MNIIKPPFILKLDWARQEHVSVARALAMMVVESMESRSGGHAA